MGGDAGLGGDPGHRRRMVAARDLGCDAQAVQPLDGFPGAGPQGVGDFDLGQPFAVAAEVGSRVDPPGRSGDGRHEVAASKPVADAVEGPLDSLAGLGAGIGRDAQGVSDPSKGARDRVGRAAFESGGDPQALAGVQGTEGGAAAHQRLAHRQRAGLVEHDPTHVGQRLDGLGARDQQAAARERRGGCGDRRRRGQGQRAGAGHDQHRQRRGECARRVHQHPGAGDHRGRQQHPADEPRRPAIRQSRDGGALRLRPLQQPDDARHHGLVADGVDPDACRPGEVDRSAENGLIHLALHGVGFAGEHRLVHRGGAVDESAVGRKGLADRDQHDVARREVDHGHALGGVSRQPDGARRLQAQQRVAGAAGAVPRRHLHEPAQRQQEDERRHRVEVHLAAPGEGVEGARAPGQQQRQRHRHVHAELAGTEAAPGACQEWPPRIDQHRRRDQHADQPQVLPEHRVHPVEGAGVHRDGEHHHLHHAEPGERQPLQCLASFAYRHLERVGGAKQVRPVAETVDRAQDRRQRPLACTPFEPCAACRGIDGDRGDPGQPLQPALHQPPARGAAQALQQQVGAGSVAAPGDRPQLDLGPVVGGPGVVGRRLGAGRRRVPEPVVVGESRVADEFRRRLAAFAAHRAGLARDPDRKLQARWNWLAAVETLRCGLHDFRILQAPARWTPPDPGSRPSASSCDRPA